jgi:hypothetical protein
MFTMNWLSSNEARFGNKIFAYFFLVYLNRQTGMKCTAGEWAGNRLFQLPLPTTSKPIEPYINVNLETQTDRNSKPIKNALLLKSLAEQSLLQVEIRGSFQYNTDQFNLEDKELFQSTYQLNKTLKKLFDKIVHDSTGGSDQIIAIHYRAGDYLSFNKHPLFWTPPFQSIIELTKTLVKGFPSAKLYLASDSLAIKAYFYEVFPEKASWNILASEQFGHDLMLDFIMLMRANLVVAANSSFSIGACLMNSKAGSFIRPSNRDGDYIFFDPWNTPVLIQT